MRKGSLQRNVLVLCFDPNLGTTRQRLVWRIDDSTRPVDRHLGCVLVALVRLHRDDRLALSCLAVASDDVLVDMDLRFHCGCSS
jgi:hypothetical protein